MKKLLVLALVLSVASMASAALTITGAPAGPVALGSSIVLGIDTTAVTAGQGDGYWALVCTKGTADLLSGVSLVPAESGIIIDHTDTAANLWTTLLPEGYGDGISGVIALVDTSAVAAGPIYSGITFNGLAGGLATVTLFYSADGGTSAPVSSASFVVTPEPVTMMLLGLGGLFLRRRK